MALRSWADFARHSGLAERQRQVQVHLARRIVDKMANQLVGKGFEAWLYSNRLHDDEIKVAKIAVVSVCLVRQNLLMWFRFGSVLRV